MTSRTKGWKPDYVIRIEDLLNEISDYQEDILAHGECVLEHSPYELQAKVTELSLELTSKTKEIAALEMDMLGQGAYNTKRIIELDGKVSRLKAALQEIIAYHDSGLALYHGDGVTFAVNTAKWALGEQP